ncbi:MAG TPA: DUF5320 domain-containing protein [Polyangia bacterium]|nr:DUF5320 domain-containing protein [Polyangia bacterium]
MPGRNGMGPMGQGPMTGRGMGWCNAMDTSNDVPQVGPGYGMGRGGRGGGWRHRRFWAAGANVPSAASAPEVGELDSLRAQIAQLTEELGELKNKIEKKVTP